MAKLKDIPQELKAFNEIFNQLDRKYSTLQIWEDFLTMVICTFGFGTQEETYKQTVKKYTKEEVQLFVQLCGEMMKVILPRLGKYSEENRIWYDFFGGFYEAISHKPGLGQFFTPPTLVNFMVQSIGIEKDSKDKKIIDPACGSGRFVIASHAENPQNLHWGVDVDLVCCKMTVLNMFFHGVRGEVVWG